MNHNTNKNWAIDAATKLMKGMKPEEIEYIIEKKMVFKLFDKPRMSCTMDAMRIAMITAECKAVDVLNFYYSSLIHDQLKVLFNNQKSKV